LIENLKKISNAFHQTGMESVYESISTTQKLIWFSIFFSFALAFLFSWLLEKCPGFIVGVSLVGFYLGSGFLAYLTFKKYKYYKEIYDKDTELNVSA